MSLDYDHLNKLLVAFQQFRKEERRVDPTMFEVAGYPHLENVASNILAFFLDPGQPHGLGTLFVESLLSAVNCPSTEADLENIEVNREVVTDSRYRIDLVVQTEKFTIGIENKLFASLNNDLEDYAKHLKKIAAGRKVVPILLTLYPMELSDQRSGFHPITYEKYFSLLLQSLGQSLLSANNRYFSLLLDFINTIYHLKGNSEMEDKEFFQWFGENQMDIEAIIRKVDGVKRELINKANRTGAAVRDSLKLFENDAIEHEQWVYKAYQHNDKVTRIVLVHDVKYQNFRIAVDTLISPSTIEFRIFDRNGNTQELIDLLVKYGLPLTPLEKGRALLNATYGYFDDEQVQKELGEILHIIHRAIVHDRKKEEMIAA